MHFACFQVLCYACLYGGLYIEKHQIFPFCFDGELAADTFVKSTLPPVGESVERIDKPLALHLAGSEIEDGDLLPCAAGKDPLPLAGNENTIVGIGADIGSKAHILDEQTDVAHGMILAFARCSDDGDASFSLFQKEAHGFGLVVVLLLT